MKKSKNISPKINKFLFSSPLKYSIIETSILLKNIPEQNKLKQRLRIGLDFLSMLFSSLFIIQFVNSFDFIRIQIF